MQATGVVGMGLLEGHGTTNACSLPENSAHFVRPSMRDFYLKPTFYPSPNNLGFTRARGNWGESGVRIYSYYTPLKIYGRLAISMVVPPPVLFGRGRK